MHITKKNILLTSSVIIIVLLAVITGGSFYMLSYSLSPDKTRHNNDSCYRELFER